MTKPPSTLTEEDEARRALKTVRLPAEVVAYDLRFSETDADPALWVIFQTTVSDALPPSEARAIAGRMNELANTARDALLDAVPGRYPYFTFASGR